MAKFLDSEEKTVQHAWVTYKGEVVDKPTNQEKFHPIYSQGVTMGESIKQARKRLKA